MFLMRLAQLKSIRHRQKHATYSSEIFDNRRLRVHMSCGNVSKQSNDT